MCRRRVDRDIERELAFHLAETTDHLVESGYSLEQAQGIARRRFGNYSLHKENTLEADVHRWIESIHKDLRYGGRSLLRSPGFTLAVVLTLAVGIGANTLIFSVVNGLLLRPLPYRDSDRLMTLWQVESRSGENEGGAAPGNFWDWLDQNQVFEGLAAAEPRNHNLTGEGEPEAFRSWIVTEGFFQILGVDAVLGRTFTEEEYQPGNHRVVVLGHGLWRQRFGADPQMVGRELLMNGQPHRVVGVMPPEFQFPAERQLWAPRLANPADSRIRGYGFLPVIGKLRPGVSLAQAQDEMNRVAADLARDYPQANQERGVRVVPLWDQTVGHLRPALLVLLGAVGLVLLIACANVAGLLLVRGAEREREFAIRGTLGAGRGRLTQQWLIESGLLALAGTLSGMLMAHWALRAALALAPDTLPRAAEIGMDGRVVGFLVAVSIFTMLIFTVAPALHYTNPDVSRSLQKGGRGVTGPSRHRLRDALVVSQVAVALILSIGAGLLTRSLVLLHRVDPGFSGQRVLSLEVHVWGQSRTPEQRANFFEETLDRLSALPGVQATPSRVLGMTIRQGILLITLGLSIGLAGSLGLTRSLQSLLFGVGPVDLLTYAFVSGVVAAVGLLASYIPVRRTLKLDPLPRG